MRQSGNLVEITVPSSGDGKTIKQFLREELSFSMHQISRIKYRPEGITLNGAPVRVTAALREGDLLVFSLDADIPETVPEPAAPEDVEDALPVLYEDPFLLIVNKPAGIVSHPSHGHHGDSALDLMEMTRGRLYLAGRLDKDTSGVLVFAKHKETASLLAKERTDGRMQKVYLAAVCGRPDPPAGRIDTPIGIVREMPLLMGTDPVSGKRAETVYRTILTEEYQLPDAGRTGRDKEIVSLLQVGIRQGRTHQIRVHLSSIGCPLIGDGLYGGFQKRDKEMEMTGALQDAGTRDTAGYAHLHAWKVTLRHPYTGAEICAAAPLPDWAGRAEAGEGTT